MAISFEKLIGDVQGFSDATEIPITIGSGDSATTERLRLGDIRGQLSNTLARYEAALQQEREQRGTLESTLRALKEQPPEKEHRNVAQPQNGAPSEDDLNADPWTRSVRQSVMNEVKGLLDENIKGVRKEHGEFADLSKKGVGALTQLLLKLQAKQDFDSYKDWPKEYDPGRAFKEASDKGYISKETGLPDLSRLYHEVTEESRVEQRAKALAEKMREEERKAEAEKNASRFQRVGIPNNSRSKQGKKERKYTTLQDYMQSEDALPTDDEVRSAGLLNAIIR